MIGRYGGNAEWLQNVDVGEETRLADNSCSRTEIDKSRPATNLLIYTHKGSD